MKKIFLTVLSIAFVVILQAQATPTSVTYNKVSQPAIMLELPYNVEVSEGFIVDNLKKTGYDAETKGKLFWKQNKLNGYYIFKGVRLEGAPGPMDLYFKVDKRGKKDAEQSVIYMMAAKDESSFISSSDSEAYIASKSFLNGFITKSAVYKLDLDIKGQEEAVAAAEKKQKKLEDNQKDMEKKIEDLQKDLKKNLDDQTTQKAAIDTERKKLEALKSRKQ